METTELLEILNGIFRKVLKRRRHIDRKHYCPGCGRMGFPDQYGTAHRNREKVRCAFFVSRDSEIEKCGRSLPYHHE